MGLISPGPVVIMGTFAGYLVAAVVGAVVATVALFTPTYLFVVVPGRLFRRFEQHPRLQGFVKGATAAAAGAIAGAAIVIGRQTIHGSLPPRSDSSRSRCCCRSDSRSRSRRSSPRPRSPDSHSTNEERSTT
jgi:Chromate transporter